MANPRKIRGDYRPIYVTLFNGKDYRALSPTAKLVLLTIKGLAGASGLKVWPALSESLAELTGHKTTETRRAVKELIDAEWIQYQDGILWLVRGLEFEPQVSHGEKHRAWIANELRGLPRSPIIDRFRAHYAEFFPQAPAKEDSKGDDEPIVWGDDTLSPPHTIPNPNHQPLPQPLPHPVSLTTVRNPSKRTVADDVLLLTIAANAGITAKYGEQPNPIHYGHAGAIPTVEALRAEGVDIEFAHAVVFAYASTLTLAEPPRSIKFFRDHVIRRWRSEQARRDSAGYRPETAKPTPEIDQMRAFAIRYAREGHVDHQAYCDERGIVWREVA